MSPSKPPQRKRKERSPTSVDGVQEQSSPEHYLPTEDTNKGEFDIPIAERLKLRREKRKIVPPVAEKKGSDAIEGTMSTMAPSINLRKRKSTVLDSGSNKVGKGNDMGGNAKACHQSTPKQIGEIPPGVNQVSSGKWVSFVLYILYYIMHDID